MPLYGSYLCEGCLRPVPKPGKCNNCVAKEIATIRAGNYCDHCHKHALETQLYLNIKTRTRYCSECIAQFRSGLIWRGAFTAEQAEKIIANDFVPITNPTRKPKLHKKPRNQPDPIE